MEPQSLARWPGSQLSTGTSYYHCITREGLLQQQRLGIPQPSHAPDPHSHPLERILSTLNLNNIRNLHPLTHFKQPSRLELHPRVPTLNQAEVLPLPKLPRIPVKWHHKGPIASASVRKIKTERTQGVIRKRPGPQHLKLLQRSRTATVHHLSHFTLTKSINYRIRQKRKLLILYL